tara:strand:+ start:1025 stop:1363 length:339 start_codon:yes stop_codon:yes gene_type:complete
VIIAGGFQLLFYAFINGMSPYPQISVPIAISVKAILFSRPGQWLFLALNSLNPTSTKPDGLKILNIFMAFASASNARTTIAAPLRENQMPKSTSSGLQGTKKIKMVPRLLSL